MRGPLCLGLLLRAGEGPGPALARLIVVGMGSNGFTIANPDDAGMLDVVGFDTTTPELISGFAAGTL